MVIRTAAAATARAGAGAPRTGRTRERTRSRQEKARSNARREILEAAAGVFARRGYAASTLTELAQAAGYAAPSLYRYFSSKEEIFRSLVALLKADLMATFEARVRGGDGLANRLEALLAAQIELARRRREVFALLASTPPGGLGLDPPLHDLRAGASLYERWLAGWMRRHVAARELRCPLWQAARALAGAARAFHHASVLGPASGLDPAEEARLVVDLALHGIAATPAPGPPGRRGASP
jgi:AcrR family transcriptional regulator